MKIMPHNVNFKHHGAWYELADGRGIYLAHRRMSQVLAKKNAWCIERIALEDTLRKGYQWAGVIVKVGKKKHIYATLVSDFFEEGSFSNPKNILQRCLPLSRFRYTPSMNRENVEAAMKLR